MKRQILIVLSVFIFGGCATYHARPLAADKTASDFETRTLTDPGLLKYLGKSPTAWDLGTLTLVAFYFHPDLDVARAQWGVAKAAQLTAGERPNPTLGVTPEYATNEPPDSSPWVLTLALDFPIETAGKRGYRLQQSRALSEAARLHIARVAWQVRSRVRMTLLALYSAVRSEAILQSQQKQLNQNRDLLQRRTKGGYASPLAMTQAEVLAGRNDVTLKEQQRLELMARGQLADALGLPIQAIKGIPLSLNSYDLAAFLPETAFSELRQQALKSRSDIQESLANYAVSQHALQLEVAKQYPDIHLGPGYIFDQGVNRWVLSLLSALPIFNRNRGAIGETAARRKEAGARFMAIQDQAIGEMDRAIGDYSAARRKLETANTLLSKHLQQDKALQRLLHPGDLSRTTLFRAQLDIDSTRLIASDALVQFHQAEGALEDALERPLPGNNRENINAELSPRELTSSPLVGEDGSGGSPQQQSPPSQPSPIKGEGVSGGRHAQ